MPAFADWLPTRGDIPSVSLFPKGRIVVVGFLAGSYGRSIQQNSFGVNLSAPWFGKILRSLFQKAMGLPLRPLQNLHQVPQLMIPSAAHGVRLRVFAHDLELGRDQGLLWAKDGILHYEGLETRFAVGKADLIRMEICDAPNDPHFIIVRTLNNQLAISVLSLNAGDHADIRRTLEEWGNSSPCLPSELLPPIGIQRRKRLYLIEQTLRRGWLAYAVFAALIGINLPGVIAEASASFMFRINAVIAVATLHILVATYEKVRRQEELRVRNHRPFTQPPVVAAIERTAAELSVGVRLNAL